MCNLPEGAYCFCHKVACVQKVVCWGYAAVWPLLGGAVGALLGRFLKFASGETLGDGPRAMWHSGRSSYSELARNCSSFTPVRARPGWLSALSVSLCESVFDGAFVWVRRAVKRQKWRFPAGAVFPREPDPAASEQSAAGGRAPDAGLPAQRLLAPAGRPGSGAGDVVARTEGGPAAEAGLPADALHEQGRGMLT